MKKFMIFLLMAFLYLGTCQARSESAHPNDGRLKLLSWVSPTPSQSFLTRSDAVTAGDFSLTPSGSVNLGVTTNNTKTFTRPTGPELRASGVLAADQTVTSSKWYLDNAVVATSGASYTVSGLNAGTHTLYAEVSGEGFTKTSNPVTITVAETEFTVEIVGLTEACPDQTVILTSVIEGPSQVTGQTYLWKIDGEAAPGVNTNQTYEFIPSEIFQGAEIDSVHEFVVEVNREGCLQTPSPVHYFRTLPVAQLSLTLPTQVCKTGNTTLIAENTNAGTAPVAYKWFVNEELVATTTTNEYVITNTKLESANSIWVVGTYDNVICNTDTFKKSPVGVEFYPALDELSLTSGDADNLVCENSMVTFTIGANANATNYGAATYTWFVNDVEVGTTTDLNYNVTLEAAGTYQVKVTGEYANYPCGTSVSNPINVTVEAAPAIAFAGDNVICNGQTENILTATPTTYTYAWTKPATTPATSNNNTVNAIVPGTYTVTGTATSGCTATATYTVYQFGGDLQVSASNYYVCPGEVVALNANYEGFTNENITYTWEAPTGVTLSNTTGSTVTATIPSTASGALTFKVTATAAEGCSIQYNVVVNVIPADAANLTVSIIDNPTCVGGQVKAKITNKPENYNGLFTWYLNGIEIPGENLDSIMLHLNQAGTYTFGATLANTVCNLVTPVTAQNTVTVNDMPEITITGDNVICQNASATMTATNITGASYTWAVPTGAAPSNTNVQTTTIPGVYAVTASKDGCQAMAEFTVYQLGGDLQVYASEQDVCPGTSVMLNANLDGFGNQNIAYKWDANANNATTPTVVVTPSATKTYTVTAYATTADAAQMETACQIVSSISVNVIQETNPTVTVTLQSDQHICEGGLVNLKANASNVSAYTWYMDGIEIPGQNLPEIALNLYDLGTHTFAAKPEGFVCITPNAVPADKSVTVHAVPQVTVTGADVICNGNTTTLTANVVPAGNYTYAWTGPNTTGSNATLDVTVAGVYTVVVTDPTSKCVATADFTVYATGADLQLTADKMEICKGDMVVLNANLDGFNNENVEYAWTGNGLDAIATGSTVHATPNAAGLQKYVVTATAGNCTMKDSLNINVVDVVNVATVVPSIEAVCVGEQVTLQANADPAGSATEFIWYMNGVEIAGENQPSITMNMNEAGNYSFAAKAAVEGCHTSTASTPVTVTVNATPVVVITGEHYYTTDANNPAVLTATTGYASYAWSNGATENPLNVTEYGVYTVTVTDANGCVGVSEPFTVSSMVDMQAHIEGVDNACQHDDVTLTAVVDNDLEGHTYQWMVNGQYITDGHNIAGATTAHLTFNVDSLYKYYGATLTNEFTVEIGREGCATVTAPVHPFTINPVPYVMVVAPEMVCEGNGATLEAAVYSIGENAQYQYIWFKDNVAVDTIDYLNTYNVAAEDIAGHTYAVQAIFQNSACSSDTSEAVTIQFYQKPVAIKMNVSDPSNICETNQATLTITDNNAENTFGAVTYTWFVNGIEVPNVYGNIFTADFDHNGEYSFWATAHYANYPCADIYTDTMKVNVNNVPELAIVGDNVICAGQETNTLTATTGFASYVWTKPDGTTNNAGNTLNANTPGHYTLVATATAENGGCVAIEEFEVAQFGADLQVMADKMEICQGEMVVMNANLDGFIDETISYAWNGDGIVTNAGSTISAIPTATGDVTYTVTASTAHCSVVGNLVIKVHELPAAVTATLLTDADICAGEQATLQAIPASTDLAYIWFQNGIQIPGENLNTITVNLNDAGTYNYSVIAVNQYGCYTGAASTTPTVVGTVDVPTTTITNTDNTTVTITITNNGILIPNIFGDDIFIPISSSTTTETETTTTTETNTTTETLTLTVDLSTLPAAEVTVHAAPDFTLTGNNIVCNGATATINATSNTADTYTYTWSNGTTGATFTTTTAGTYSVTATDGTCTSTQTFNVYTNGSDLQVYADKMEVCEGEMVVLNANLAGFTNDNIAYTWAGEGLVATTGSTVSATPTMANHTYTVTATTTGTNAGCTMTGSINITVHPVPAQVTVLANRNTVCEGGQITFNADGNANAYIWYQNGVEIPGENQATLTINFNEIGSYAIAAKAVSENGCISALASEPVVVNVVMQPTVQITGDPIICHTDPVVLYANLNDTDASLDYTYEWRLYNYTLGAQTIEGWLPIIGAYTIPNPIDAPAFMDMPILTTAILGNENFVAIDPTLGFPAQDYPYIFTVVVTTPEGCRVESEPYYVYVGEDPEVVVTVDYDTVCAEGEITATAHLGNWNMDNLVAQWQVSTDGGETWTNIDYGTSGILHHVPGVTSQYRIVVTQTTTGCTAISEPVNVAVIVPASIHSIVAINHDETYPTDNVCEGAQLDVTAYLVQLDEDGNPIQKVDENGNPVFDANGEPVYETYIDNSLTYMWKLNGMELQTVHGAQFSAQAYIYDSDPVDYTYEAYIVYDMPGCELVPVASNTVHVKRNPIVTIDGNPNVCYYGPSVENIVLTAWVDGRVDLDATYTWYESGQYRPNPSGFDNNYRESWVPTYENPYIFTVEVTNGDGCTTISDPFYVNVYERPYTNITGDASEICEGGNVTLRANLDNYNDPMLTYQWYKNEVNNTHILPGATHEVETFEPALGATNYIVKVTHLMDFNTQYCVAYDTFRVNVNAIPVVTAMNDLSGVDTICEGRTVKMTATTIGGVAGGEVYTWYRNGEIIENVTTNVLVDAPTSVDNEPAQYVYSVKVRQAASGCESETFTFAPIVVNPNPTIELVTDPIVCAEGANNVVLYANVDPMPATTLTYRWFEDNAPVAVTEDSVYMFTKPYRDYPYSFAVELVNDYGCVARAEASVYVNAAPVVNITATETQICNGGEITLTATLDDWNADMLTFQWYDGETAIAGANELSYTVVPTVGAHDYHVAIHQLTSLCDATSNHIAVNVVADPVVMTIANNIPEENAVCDGYQVELTANIEGGVAGGETYVWYRNGEIIEGAVAANFSEVVSALNNEPTAYTYAVEVAQTAAGCASTVKTMNAFTVNPNPTIELVTDPIVCAEGENNVVLYANVEPTPATAIEYKWLENNAVFATTTVDSIALTKPYRDYPYSFAVQIVNEYACSATSEALVYVNAAPVVNITATETNICEGGEITLTATLNDWNADQLTFQWYDGETAIAGATELSYTVVPALGSHDYHVAIHQLTSLCDATSNHITVTVNEIPVIASVTASQYNICNGGQLTITATPVDGYQAGEVYTWYRNGVLIPGAVTATINDTPATVDNNTQQYVYTAVVTRPQAGCTSDITVATASSSVVTVYPNPVVVITGDQHVCETDSVFLIANVDTTGMNVGSLHYTWYESGQIRDNMAYNLGDNSFYAEYFYARTEPYRFTVNVERNDVAAGCASMSAEYLVYVYPQPVVNITASETQICTNGEVTLTANLNDNNAENIIYQWYEIRYHDVTTTTSYDSTDNYEYETHTEAYRYNIPGATAATYTTNLAETTTLGVMVRQTNSECWANDEVEIVVNPIPVVTNVTVNGVAVDTVCDGAQVTVAATINANGTPGEAVYTWYRNGVLIEGANEASFSENVYTTDNHVTYNNYTVVVTLPASGCTSEMSAMAGVVRINPAPTTVSISGINTLCENDSTVLTAYSDVEGEWTWSTGSHEQSITVPAGVYTVTLKTVEGCEMTSEPFTVEALGTDLLVSASATSICRGEHTTLYVNQDGWQGNVTYAWDAQADNSTATTVDVQPDSTTTYHVTATVSSTNGSCTAEGEVTIIVNQLPAQLVVNATTATTICEGNQVSFHATGDATTTAYIWYQNGVEIAGENQADLTVNYNEAGNYAIAAKAISNEGCVSALASEPVVVTVTPAPSQVTITGVNVLCENTTTTLTAQSDVEGIFVWSTGDTAATVTVPAGSYNVTMITAEGCQMTSDNFTVEAFGTDLLVSASATSICRGEHTTLYVDQNGWQGNVTYAWDAQAGNSTATTVDVQPDSTTTYHVTATVSSTNGSCTAEGEVTIIVNQLPAQLVVNATTATTICEGNQVSFHATGDATTTAYIWYQNGVEIAGENQADLTVNYNEAGNYAIAAKAISNEGCVSALASEPVVVTVTPAPSQVTITGVNVLCENTTTTLTAQSDVEGIFVWSTGDTAATVTVPAGSYNVTMITAEGCQMTSDNFTVEAFGTDLLVSASATSICRGEHTTLYVDQNGWQGNVTYAWDAQAGNSTATTVDVQPDSTTTYHVTATVSSTNGSCTAEGEVTIIVNQLPAQLVVNATTATTICEGNQVSFHATGDATTTAYIWYQNGVEIAGENQADLTVNYNEAGNYAIAAKAISNEGCVSALASEPVVVTVTPAPSQVTITGVNVLCENTTTTLTAQSDVEGIFVWSTGDTAATVTVPAGSYNVTMITAEGCQMTSDNFTVEAFGTDLLVSASATSICRGEHTTLYVDQNGWQGNVTYAWDAQAGNSTATTVDVQPAATTTYTVTATVSSTNGSCTAVGEVTIVVNPLPVVAAVTATETVVCEGTQVTFTAAGDANTTAYIWYNNGVEIAGENQATLTVNFNEEGVYNYAVKAISTEGCVSAVAVNAPAVTVNAAPESVTISGNTVICDGGITTLYANVVPNQPATYTWFKDNVVVNANTESLVVTAAGSYKVVAAFNGCSTESDAVVVTVEQAPQMQLTATESTICAGGTTVITAEATGWNNGNVNYNWSNNYQGSAYTFTPANAGTYTFYVTASQATAGCQAVDSITINVNEIPATPVVTVDNAVVCDGGQVTLQVTNGVAGASYIWTKNGVVMAGANGATLYDSPVTVDGDATNYVYTVVAELPISGCTSNASANMVVTVIPTPVVAVSVEGNTTLCAGGSTTLHANVTPANANYNYQWYKDNVLIEGATTADYTAAEVARETAYNFSVVVTANAGCNVTANAPAITFVADPVVEAVISNNISCVGGTATLTAIVDGGVANVNGLNGYTFEWYRNNPNNEDPNNPYSTTEFVANTAVYTTTGNEAAGNYSYWVTVTSNYGCQTTSAPVNYSVIADPVVTIAVAQGYAQAVCDGGESMLKANVTGGYGEVAYQWYKNGNLLVGETNQTLALNNLTYGVNDIYTVEVAQTGVGCGNSASAALNTLVTVAPTYTVNITGFGNVCEGGLLTLNATVNGVLNGDVLSYQWYRVANGTASAIHGANAAQYQTSDLLLGDSYEYYVVVTSNISGCSVVSTSVPANVVAAPTVAIQGANTVCEGGDLTLNAFVNGGVEGAAYTYTWNWTGAANGSATTAVPTFVPTVNANDAATPYYFTVTISRNDNTGCTATSAAHEVNVLAVPTVSVTADNSNVCVNGQVTFTAHVSPVGAYNYVWTINGQQQAVNAATVTTSMANTGTINASVVVAAANASASCSATATIATPVNVVAAPTVTLAANHTTMCVGGVTTLTATVNANNNIPGNFNYEWIVDGTPVAGVTNTLNQTLNAAGIHTYQVRVSQNNELGCSSTWSNQATVQVAEQPVVTLSSADGLAICEGGSITLTGVVTNYGNTVNGVTNSSIYGNMTFDWTANGVNVHHNTNVNNAQNQVTETLNTVGNYTYQVSVDAAGYNCQPQISNEYTVNVVGNPSWTDVHVYSNNGTDACLGETVYLMAGIQGGVSDYASSTNGHIQWVVTDENGNTVNVGGGLGGNSYDVPTVAGTYIYTPTFVGNIGSGCQLTNTDDVQVAVTVHELPTAEFISGDGVALCANDPSASAELVISFTGVAPFHYQVVDGNGNIIAQASTMANTATIYVAPTEQTTYMITTVQDAYCQNSTLESTAVATVYVNDIEFADNFFVSGCTDNGQVTISFNMISGNPSANFTVVYENGMQASGTIVNNTATFAAPTVPGDYNAVFTVDGCSYDIVVRVLVGDYGFGGTLPIMDQRWNDVVVVNNNPETNGGHTFVGFQWYHNGVAIPGATYSNYQDKGGLNGFYSVELTEQDADGNMITFMTCEMYFNATSTVKVYPVPANVRQEITIELDLTAEELEGAVLDIYSVTGAHVSHVTDLQPITKIEGFKAQGTYFGRILTGTNEIKTVKFVIVK